MRGGWLVLGLVDGVGMGWSSGRCCLGRGPSDEGILDMLASGQLLRQFVCEQPS